MDKYTSPLNNLKVASPCSQDWNAMIGNDRKRFCGDCKLNVYNLSGMTRAEAENLLLNSEGRLCVRFYKRADGTVLTQDCPVGWQAVKKRVSRMAAAFVSLIFGLLTGLGLMSLLAAGKPKEQRLMGAIAYNPTPKPKRTPKQSVEVVETMGDVVMGEMPEPASTPKPKATPKKEEEVIGKVRIDSPRPKSSERQ